MTDFEFKQTCSACPEQYDVMLDGRGVGYVRLRHGIFRVDHSDGTTLLRIGMPGGTDGVFDNQQQRDNYLYMASRCLTTYIEKLNALR